jgi:hypothetical protein
MMPRDMRRNSGWHKGKNQFAITVGPLVQSVADNSVVIRWATNEVSQGWIEYASLAANVGGSSDSETTHETSFQYATHTQTISGLSPASTYYYRVVSVSQNAITVASPVLSVTTSGTQPPPNPPSAYGPRYAFYGAGPSGNFPTWPTGSNVKYAPASIRTASNVAGALSQWINAQPNGSIIVLDSSGGTSGYGAGTEYVLQDILWVSGGGSSPGVNTTTPRTFTIWGYNTRIKDLHEFRLSPLYGDMDAYRSTMLFSAGGFLDCQLLGLEVVGHNTGGGTFACRAYGSEGNHAMIIMSYNNFLVQDCWFHNVGGELINLSQAPLGTWGNYVWSWGRWPRYMNIKNNLLEKNGRMGIATQQGEFILIEKNIIRDIALGTIDAEDHVETVVAPYRQVAGLTVQDNLFDSWNWHINTNNQNYWAQWMMQGVHVNDGMDFYRDWVFRRNEYRGGHRGVGYAPSEQAFWGYVIYPRGPSGVRLGVVPAPWQLGTATFPHTNLTIENEVSYLAADQTNGAAWFVGNWGGNVFIRNNNFQGMPIHVMNLAPGAVTDFSGNGSSVIKNVYPS